MSTDNDFVQDYNDPQSDIVLQSTDGKRFSVHYYVLRASNAQLPEMLGLPSSPPGYPPDNPININYTADDFKLFLDLLNNSSLEIPEEWHYHKRLYDMVNQFQCNLAKERLLYRMPSVAKEAPWEAFVVAASSDNLPLAKAALAVMHMDDAHRGLQLSTMTRADAAQLPLVYLLGLMRVMAKHPEGEMYAGGTRCLSWGRISDEFSVVR